MRPMRANPGVNSSSNLQKIRSISRAAARGLSFAVQLKLPPRKSASFTAAEALTRFGERHVFWLLFGAAPPYFRELLVRQAIRAGVLCFHFEQQPCRVFLTRRRPGADALQYRGDLILFHPAIILSPSPAHIPRSKPLAEQSRLRIELAAQPAR